jgi:hypothetical protein
MSICTIGPFAEPEGAGAGSAGPQFAGGMLESPAAPAAPLLTPAAPACALEPPFDEPAFDEPAFDVEVPPAPALIELPAAPLVPSVPAAPELAPEVDEPQALTPLANESQSGAESANARERKRALFFWVCMVRIPRSGVSDGVRLVTRASRARRRARLYANRADPKPQKQARQRTTMHADVRTTSHSAKPKKIN